MPVYEYQCRTCDERFEARRPMADAGTPISCPQGHEETMRVLSAFASVGTSSSAGGAPAPPGGCGGGCRCAAQA
ncbi:MAG TPA: zinc ribbon domain-containing protein [Acidimicrobiales bacterium]|nr:zinc ribbon domain-containing protein [Acidimicrobiales bacterium]